MSTNNPVTLKFNSLMELIDFQLTSDAIRCAVDAGLLTITGAFSEADIELAKAGFNAQIDRQTIA
jgi:hypothetical protein